MSKLLYLEVVNAVNRVHGWRDDFELGALEKQLSQTLQVSKNRGEFDGTIKSALACLSQSGYEVNHLIEAYAAKQAIAKAERGSK